MFTNGHFLSEDMDISVFINRIMHVLDRYRGLPNVMIQHFFKVDVIMFIQSEWISNYICNFHPGIDKNYFHNLK